MQTMAFPINWGDMTLVLDQRAFGADYAHGRQYYFEDAWEEQKGEGRNEALTTEHLLGLIAIRDEQGHYQLDDGRDKSAFPNGVEELSGVLVGYLSGPLHPETHEECAKRLSGCMLIEE